MTAKGTPGSARRRRCRGCTPRAPRKPPRSCSRWRGRSKAQSSPRGAPPSTAPSKPGWAAAACTPRSAPASRAPCWRFSPTARGRISRTCSRPVRRHACGSTACSTATPRRSSTRAAHLASSGYTALKIKVGRRDSGEEAKLVAAVRAPSARRSRCASTRTAPGTSRRPSTSRRASHPPGSSISRNRCAKRATSRPSWPAPPFPSPSTKRCSASRRSRRRRCRAWPR